MYPKPDFLPLAIPKDLGESQFATTCTHVVLSIYTFCLLQLLDSSVSTETRSSGGWVR